MSLYSHALVHHGWYHPNSLLLKMKLLVDLIGTGRISWTNKDEWFRLDSLKNSRIHWSTVKQHHFGLEWLMERQWYAGIISFNFVIPEFTYDSFGVWYCLCSLRFCLFILHFIFSVNSAIICIVDVTFLLNGKWALNLIGFFHNQGTREWKILVHADDNCTAKFVDLLLRYTGVKCIRKAALKEKYWGPSLFRELIEFENSVLNFY